MEQADRRALWLTGVGHALGHGWELIFPAVAVPLAVELELTIAETVRLSFFLYLLYGLGAPIGGWLTDRIGGRGTLLICLTLGGLASVGVSFTQGTLDLAIALGVLGLAASLYHPAGLALLSHHFEHATGRALAINGMAGNVGIGMTPIVAGLIASIWGWRWAYLAMGVPGVLFAIAFFVFRFPDEGHPDFAKPDDSEGEKESPDWTAIALLAVAMASAGLAYRLHTLVMPALIGERLPELEAIVRQIPGAAHLDHLENLGATALTSCAYLMGLFGQWFGGKVADGKPLVPAYIIFHAIGMPLALAAAFGFGPFLILVLFVYMFFAFGMQPIENSLVARMSGRRYRGRAYAGKFVLTFGVGALGAPLVGIVAPWGGLGASLTASAALELTLVFFGLLLWLRLRSRR